MSTFSEHDAARREHQQFDEEKGARRVAIVDENGDQLASLPVSVASLPLPTGAATSDKQDNLITELQVINSLVPSKYDYISLSYTGTNLTGVVYKTGGSTGTTIATLTLGYDGSNQLTSVTKS